MDTFPGALPFARHDRAAVPSWRLQHASEMGSTWAMARAPASTAAAARSGRLETTEEVRLLEEHGCGILRSRGDGCRIGDAGQIGPP